MALFERKQQLGQGVGKPMGPTGPEKMPPPKEEKKDTSIFGGKKEISMQEARWKMRKGPSVIPGTGGLMFAEKEKVELFDKATKKWGLFLNKNEEVPKIFKALKQERFNAKTDAERLKIDRQIRYLEQEKLFGKQKP